jgi:hypothetical protein
MKTTIDHAALTRACDAYTNRRAASLGRYSHVIGQAIGYDNVPGGSWLNGRDAQEGNAFMISQLAGLEAKSFARQFTPLQYEQFIPISYEIDAGAETVRYQTYDNSGVGRRTSPMANDLNVVGMVNGEVSFQIAPGDIAYSYTQQELRTAAYLKRPLSTTLLNAAVDGWRKHMNAVGLTGNKAAEPGLDGLLNHSAMPFGNAPNGVWATAAAPTAAIQTPDKILADMNACLQQPYTASKQNDIPDTLLMSVDRFALINSTRVSVASDTTILEYFKANNLASALGQSLKIAPAYGLETMGVGGTNRMIAYRNDPDKLIMHIPLRLQFLAPQFDNLRINIPGEYRYTGVNLRYPKSFYAMDNI